MDAGCRCEASGEINLILLSTMVVPGRRVKTIVLEMAGTSHWCVAIRSEWGKGVTARSTDVENEHMIKSLQILLLRLLLLFDCVRVQSVALTKPAYVTDFEHCSFMAH